MQFCNQHFAHTCCPLLSWKQQVFCSHLIVYICYILVCPTLYHASIYSIIIPLRIFECIFRCATNKAGLQEAQLLLTKTIFSTLFVISIKKVSGLLKPFSAHFLWWASIFRLCLADGKGNSTWRVTHRPNHCCDK